MILQLLATVVVEGSTANLTCVVRAEPPPEVQWFAPNKTVPFSSQASTNLVSLIHLRYLRLALPASSVIVVRIMPDFYWT